MWCPEFRKFGLGPFGGLIAIASMLTSCAEISISRLRSSCENSAETRVYDSTLWAGYLEKIKRNEYEDKKRGINRIVKIDVLYAEYEYVHSEPSFGKTMEWNGKRPRFYNIVRDDVDIYMKQKKIATFINYMVLYKTLENETFDSCLTMTSNLYIQRQRQESLGPNTAR